MDPYYSDSYVTLYHGDCREILPSLEPMDCCITDPPYGLKPVYPRKNFSIIGDSDTKLIDWIISTYCVDVPTIIFSAPLYFPSISPQRQLIWDKKMLGLSGSKLPWRNSHEIAWVYGLGWKSKPQMGTVFRTSRDHTFYHPTQKPLALMRWLVQATQNKWTITDPCSGGGSTLVAAKNHARRSIGIEIEEEYCEMTARRCETTPVLARAKSLLDFAK